jgi:hypothetical protein
MRALAEAIQTCSSIAFRLLGKKHSASLVLIGTLALAGSATLYLPQVSGLAGSISGSGQDTLHDRACADQNYAWSTYSPSTDYFYCPENAPQP